MPARAGETCSVDGCQRLHEAKGYCRMHYKRLRATGDPTRKSRFATQAEKDAFVAADIAARRERRAAQQEQQQDERLAVMRQRRSVLAEVERRPVGPHAVALVEALDTLSEDDRAHVASAFVTVLLGRPVDLRPSPSPNPTNTEPSRGATP